MLIICNNLGQRRDDPNPARPDAVRTNEKL